jgi:hypothetical protein
MGKGPLWVNPPFALFVLVETSPEVNFGHHSHSEHRVLIPSSQTINKILTEAHSSIVSDYFWLATKDYASAPVHNPHKANLGTSAPISPSYPYSDFVGQKVTDVAQWLKLKPETADLDEHHFVILDRRAEKDGTVVVCRIGDAHLEGDKLDYIRFPAEMASLHLGGMEFGTWEDFNGDGSGTAKIEY